MRETLLESAQSSHCSRVGDGLVVEQVEMSETSVMNVCDVQYMLETV